MVLRDHHGAFVAGACSFFPSIAEPEQAELMACRCAVQVANEMGIQKLVLETDSKTVASKLCDQEKDRSIFGPIVEETKKLLHAREEFRVAWVRRSANNAAHRLAREGCLNNLYKTWFHVSPVCIRDAMTSRRRRQAWKFVQVRG